MAESKVGDDAPDFISNEQMHDLMVQKGFEFEPANPKVLGTYHNDYRNRGVVKTPDFIDNDTVSLMEITGVIKTDVEPEAPDFIPEEPGFIDSMYKEGALKGSDKVQEKSETVAGSFDKGELTEKQVEDSYFRSMSEQFSGDQGGLTKTFSALSFGEQYVVRHSINVLENLDLINKEDAKKILSQREVHGNDIVEYYWKDPQSKAGYIGRAVLGIAASVLMDPLTYTGIGAFTQLGRRINVAGKTIKGLDKMSKGQRGRLRMSQAIEKVITPSGDIVEATSEVGQKVAQQRNIEQIAQFRDNKINLQQLNESLELSPEVEKEMLRAQAKASKNKSYAQEWVDGERGITLGYRIPFTNIAQEVDISPRWFNKLIGKSLQNVFNPYGLTEKALDATGFGRESARLMRSFTTKTGYWNIDEALNQRYGGIEATSRDLHEFEKVHRKMFENLRKRVGDEEFSRLLDDFLDELEHGIDLTPEEFVDQFSRKDWRSFGTKKDAIEKVRGTSVDPARQARLAQHPDLVDALSEMRLITDEYMNMYEELGVKGHRLNPFGEGFVNNYVKHLFTKDWIKYGPKAGKGQDEIRDALEFLNSNVGKVDKSMRARSYHGSIREANEKALAEFKDNKGNPIKKYVDDPIELFTQRVTEMRHMIENKKLFDEAALLIQEERPGLGWRRIDTKDFGNTIDNKVNFYDFVPPEFQKSGGWIPEDVYDRLLYVTEGHRATKPFKNTLAIFDAFTRFWRNQALFGFGYHGLNALSNMTTYVTHMGVDAIDSLGTATRVLLPWKGQKTIKMKNIDGSLYEMTPEQIFHEAMEDNVLGSSFSRELSFEDLTENIASNREARGWSHKVRTLADYAYLWRLNRGVAQFMDDIPKLATYINRRKRGFSRQASAEISERYFYNYNNVSRTQNVIRKTIPFSTFPMKTAEMVYEQLKTGDISKLSVPFKVQDVLEGAFVPNADMREYRDESLPWYMDWSFHHIHGPIMPGQYEVIIEAPWAMSTLGMLMDPLKSVHPLITMLSLVGSRDVDEQEIKELAENDFRKSVYKNLSLVLPKPVTDALTLYDINTNGQSVLDGLFADQYSELLPVESEKLGKRASEDNLIRHRFENANEMGAYLEKELGHDWIWNIMFPERITSDHPLDRKMRGARANFFKKRVRDLTLGLATMTTHDKNFFMNRFALDRQIRKADKQLEREITGAGAMMDKGMLNKEEHLQELSKSYPLAKKKLQLMKKRDSLMEYYDFVLHNRVEFPELDTMFPGGVLGLVFGVNEYQFNYDKRKIPPVGPIINMDDINKNEIDEEMYNQMYPPVEEVPNE